MYKFFMIVFCFIVIMGLHVHRNIGKANNSVSSVVVVDTLEEDCCGITEEDEKALNDYLYNQK